MGIVAQKLATKGKERDFFAFRGGGMEREDEICSGAGRLRTSRGVREQSAGAGEA